MSPSLARGLLVAPFSSRLKGTSSNLQEAFYV